MSLYIEFLTAAIILDNASGLRNFSGRQSFHRLTVGTITYLVTNTRIKGRQHNPFTLRLNRTISFHAYRLSVLGDAMLAWDDLTVRLLHHAGDQSENSS